MFGTATGLIYRLAVLRARCCGIPAHSKHLFFRQQSHSRRRQYPQQECVNKKTPSECRPPELWWAAPNLRVQPALGREASSAHRPTSTNPSDNMWQKRSRWQQPDPMKFIEIWSEDRPKKRQVPQEHYGQPCRTIQATPL